MELRDNRGFTLVEILFTTVAIAVVLTVVNSVFFSSNDMYSRTNQRAGMQMDSRMGMTIMTREIRHAGCDPTEMGLSAIIQAASDSLRIRGDINGDGAIQTAEPSEDVTYAFDSTQQALMRDPGTGAELIVPNVTALTLTYLDEDDNVLTPLPLSAADAARVRSITISMTAESEDAGDITLTTTIALRNF